MFFETLHNSEIYTYQLVSLYTRSQYMIVETFIQKIIQNRLHYETSQSKSNDHFNFYRNNMFCLIRQN